MEHVGVNDHREDTDTTCSKEGEFIYFEEEVLSCYDTGLSTIAEGENESAADTSYHHSSLAPSSPRLTVPQHVSIRSPTESHSKGLSVSTFALISPMMFSSMAEARKLKRAALCSNAMSPKQMATGESTQEQHSPSLYITNLETGEKVLMGADDDEYTFISCNTESVVEEVIADPT